MDLANFVGQRPRRTGWLITVLAGAAIGLGHAPFDLPVFLFLGIILLVWQLQGLSGRWPAFRLGWLAGTAHFAVALNWIVEPFLVDVARHGWMAPFALIFMAGGLALFWAAAFALAASFRGASARGLALALALGMFEWLRGWIFTGFPWALSAYVWADTPVAQAAAYIGPFGLSLVTLTLATIAAMGLRGGLLAGVGVAMLIAGGLWRLSQPAPVRETPVTVRVLQPNAAQHLKWQPEMMPVFYNRLLDFTAAKSDTRPDVILWPEASVPFMLHERVDLQQQMTDAANGALVLAGIRRRDPSGSWYNTAAVLGPGGAVLAQHDKDHLVPFGEYLPFNDTLAKFGIAGLAVGEAWGFTAGTDSKFMQVADLPALMVMICYEAIFPSEINSIEDRPDWMALVTNDAWFGRWTGPYQHLAQGQFRAIEQGLPMVRAANTGVSAVIDAQGRLLKALPLNTAGWFDAALPGALQPTIYRRYGELPFFIIAMLMAGLLAGMRHRAGA